MDEVSPGLQRSSVSVTRSIPKHKLQDMVKSTSSLYLDVELENNVREVSSVAAVGGGRAELKPSEIVAMEKRLSDGVELTRTSCKPASTRLTRGKVARDGKAPSGECTRWRVFVMVTIL